MFFVHSGFGAKTTGASLFGPSAGGKHQDTFVKTYKYVAAVV